MSRRLQILPFLLILFVIFSLNVAVIAQDEADPVAEDPTTEAPTITPTLTETPTLEPTALPTNTLEPTAEPTLEPTATLEPEVTDEPTAEITAEPTQAITDEPATEVTEEPAVEPQAPAAAPPVVFAPLNLVVNSAADPGIDGICDVEECTLREAINATNANADPDTITFNIPGAGTHTIQPAEPLPVIIDDVVIDATTQPGYSGTPLIFLDGTNVVTMPIGGLPAEVTAVGFNLLAGSSTIRGFAIGNFAYGGIGIVGPSIDYNGSNFVNPFGGSAGNLIEANFIGTDVTGLETRPNLYGVIITNSANNTVGGGVAARNVISGNDDDGVNIYGAGATGNSILGNLIGVDALGNGGFSVGNDDDGVKIELANDNTVDGNVIGQQTATDTGDTGHGIVVISASGTVILNNYIGVNSAGDTALGNAGNGIYLEAADNTFTSNNRIRHNTGDGVRVISGTGNRLQENIISDNGGLGINLDEDGDPNTLDGVTPNDSGDADTGANGLQNVPILSSLLVGANSANINTTINSTPSTLFRVEYYASSACDAAGSGEGLTYLGFGEATTDVSGQVTFVTQTFGVSLGQIITGTATNLTTNDTSEFSTCSPVVENMLPIADAGDDQEVEDTDNNGVVTVELDGTGSLDTDGTIALYNWYDGSSNLIGTGATPLVELDAPGVYTLQLIVTDNNGGQDDDFVQITVTSPVVVPPAAPSDLTATAVSDTQIDLTWTDNSSDESEFSIERSLNGVDGWTEIGTPTADETSFSDEGLTCETEYFYRIRAYREGDLQFSDYSSTTSATTETCVELPPAAPSELTATAESETAISLAWVDNATTESGFSIERSDNGVDGWTEVGTTEVDENAFLDDTLTCNTQYFYRVRAGRLGVFSDYTNIASATTDACTVIPPAAPTELTATADSYRQISLAWTDNATDETGYSIERSADGVGGWTEVGTAAADATTFTDDGLTCETEYFYRVRAVRDAAFSDYSNVDSATTTACGTPQTFVVNSTADPGTDDICDVTECTLREAINAANANPAADTISFNIAGTAPFTIQPLTALPEITDPVTIDGTTQPGYVDAPIIEVDGTNVNPISEGLHITTSDSIVRGLVINRFGHDVYIESGSNNTIADNYIGIDPTGTSLLGGNAVTIIHADNNIVENNIIGGTVRVDDFDSEDIDPPVGNIIRGNHIGVDVTGTVSLNYGGIGIWVDGPDTIIGGTDPEDRNIISGNGNYGIIVFSDNTVIQGNYIGTDITGTQAIGNNEYGIFTRVLDGGITTIGGTEPGAGNLISGNGNTFNAPAGVYVLHNTVVQGNLIGTDVTGTQPLGNVGVGVYLVGDNNTVGGTEAGAGNIIRFNSGTDVSSDGVYISTGTGNIVLGNSISDNAGLGINLYEGGAQPDGVTPNDDDDVDTGSNNLQNFPVLTSAAITGTSLTVEGTLNSIAETTFRIEFFANDACDASGHGEGQTYLGFIEAATDASGDLSFVEILDNDVEPGQFITATATNLTSNDTSEFSACVEAGLDTSVPNAPAELNAETASATSIDLTWVDNATDETGYRIERSANGVDGWAEVGTAAADATSFTDDGLTCETEYFYRVQAVRDAALSDYSNTDSATTFSCVPIVLRRPADDSALTTVRPRFQWNRNNAAARYQFQLATDDDFEAADILLALETNNNRTTTYIVPRGSELAFGQYYWRVNVDSGSGTFVPASPVFSFIVTPRLPGAPRTTAPANNALLTDPTPDFAWLAVTGLAEPYTYEIQIDDDSRFRTPEVSEIVDALAFTPNTDLPDGRWFWRVRAVNDYGAGGRWSAVRRFTVDTTPPDAPLLRRPGDETNVFNPAYQWNRVATANRYRIQIAADEGFATPLVDTETRSPSYRIPRNGPVLELTTYYWRVQALDVAGNIGDFSAVFSFNNTLPRNPADGSYTTNTRPRFQWNRYTPALAYQLQVATDPAFDPADIVIDETFTNPRTVSYSVPRGSELPLDNYYWRVNVDTGSGMTESPFYFALTVSPRPPKAPVLSTPARNSTVNTATPDFTWQAVTGDGEPFSYEIQIDDDSRFRSVDQSSVETTTSYTADPLAAGRWYWRVRTVNNLGVPGTWSPAFRFDVVLP